MKKNNSPSATERVYTALKENIFQFALLPGTRLSENDVAAQMGVSRTPVREALTRLENEELVEMQQRVGWQVRPFDFQVFEELYDVRIALETAALRKLCSPDFETDLSRLKSIWQCEPPTSSSDAEALCSLDEEFHGELVSATRNHTMEKIHSDIAARIRLLRRLDFFHNDRVEATYLEHARILKTISAKDFETARTLLVKHIEESKSQVKKITMHMLYSAQKQHNSFTTPSTIKQKRET